MSKEFVFSFFSLVLLFFSACSQALDENSNELVFKVPENVTIQTNEVADEFLQKTVGELPEKYAQKPQGKAGSEYQDLDENQLRELVGTEKNLTSLVENSAKQIGADYFYVLRKRLEKSVEEYSIYKNNEKVYGFSSVFVTYDPLVSVRVIENKYTVEYVENSYEQAGNNFSVNKRIWQDGVGEIAKKYGMQNVIVPYEVGGKMVFLAEKNDRWFVMYDGERILEEFERIDFGYCCEPAVYMPRAFNYRYYVFFATQDAKQMLVEVDLGANK